LAFAFSFFFSFSFSFSRSFCASFSFSLAAAPFSFSFLASLVEAFSLEAFSPCLEPPLSFSLPVAWTLSAPPFRCFWGDGL